jgi:sugar O-acyltransferase (sialic acid O-acetyltransferase NeuD family)
MTRPLAIISAEPEVIELALELNDFEVIGVFDINPSASTLGIPHLGPDESLPQIIDSHPGLLVALAVDPPALKRKLLIHYTEGLLATLVSSDSSISPSARLGPGAIVQSGVSVLANSELGKVCKLNHGATVHHDVRVGDYCTLAPGCRLLGNVQLGDEVFIGAGAVVLPRIRIGDRATVGAGAIVTKEIPADATVVGNPARPPK